MFIIGILTSILSFYAISQDHVDLPSSEPFRLTRVDEQLTDNSEVYVYEIKNLSDDNLWILFEHDRTMTTNQLITLRLKKSDYGGMSMFQWMMDGEVDWSGFEPGLYDTFFKILPPGQSFYVCIYDNNDGNKIIDDIRIISNLEVKESFNLLSEVPANIKPSYQPNIMVIKDGQILPTPSETLLDSK